MPRPPTLHAAGAALFSRSASQMVLWVGLMLTASGCATFSTPGFDIVGQGAIHSDRPFLLSRNNRLSNHSASSAVQQDVRGVFANPAYVGQNWFLVVEVVLHEGQRGDREARLNRLLRMDVVADGAPFSVQASDDGYLRHDLLLSSTPREDKVTRTYIHHANRQNAAFQISHAQFAAMAQAEQLEISLVGSSLALHFSPDNISESFQPNLGKFLLAAGDEQTPAG
ncbi:MAG: hypothetical protein CMN28_14790 [Salinisphaeraceae bacterium]|nr:hypothetical protein [Salinisphaeraceae bacterium]